MFLLKLVNFVCSQVYKDNQLFYYIDGYDVQKSNWMRYVNPAYSSESQNLVAYQFKVSHTFPTTKFSVHSTVVQYKILKSFLFFLLRYR